MGDGEGHKYAEQLKALITAHGWQTGTMVGQVMLKENTYGLWIAISPDDKFAPPDGVLNINSAFRRAGLDIKGMTMQGLSSGHWYILVGINPPT